MNLSSNLIFIIYGGNGQLGQSIVKEFVKNNVDTISVDFSENKDSTYNVLLQDKLSFQETSNRVDVEVQSILNSSNSSLQQPRQISGIISVAGGWAGGNIKSEKLIEDCSKMWAMSVEPSVICGQLLARYGKKGSTLILTGAAAAYFTFTTPKAIAYGMAKSAVHQLVKSLAHKDSGLPEDSVVLGLMPVCLDTQANRKMMPKANFSNWTPLEELASMLFQWTVKGLQTPQNGSLIKLVTKQGKTTLEYF